MKPIARVTHRDIAVKFGCDRSTVSLALNGHPRIRPHVRKQICDLAAKMGYRPDPSLSMLARHRFSAGSPQFRASLAYIVDSKVPHYIAQQRYFDSAARQAEMRGYRLIRFDLADYPSGEAASNVLYNRGVQGVIIPDLPVAVAPFFQSRGWERFTVVCCSLGWIRVPYHVVTKDVFEGTRLVWREVVRRGYKRIGAALFRHEPVAEDDFSRYGASVAQQEELIPRSARIPFLRCGVEDKAAFLAWARKHKPEVILSSFSSAYHWLVSAGYDIPRDVAFACLLVEPGAPYTGLLIPDQELSQSAVNFLVSQIHDNQRGVPEIQQSLMLEPVWSEGRTLPVVRSSRLPAHITRPLLKSRQDARGGNRPGDCARPETEPSGKPEELP